MFSDFKNMDLRTQGFPHLREQNACPYNCYSNWEPLPPHLRMDSMKHPSSCGSGIYKSHAEYNSCCNHSCAPCYPGFGYPYCHFQHPMYYPGPYPPYPNAYPPFFVPPHYSSNAGFDYGKTTSHCCNCPNHTCHVKDCSNLKIEEQPNAVPKEGQSSLIQLPGYPYPVISLPHYRVNDGETDKIAGAQPESHNGWFPLSYLKGLNQGGDGNYFQGPYQICHAPPGNEKADEHVKDLKEINDVSKSDEAWPSKIRIVPLKLLENRNHGEIPEVCKEESKNQQSVTRIADKERSLKTIPVKKVEGENEEKLVTLEKPSGANNPKNPILVELQEGCKDESKRNDSASRVADKERTLKTIPVKQLEGSDEDKAILPEKPFEENKLKNYNSAEKKKIVAAKKDSSQKQSSQTIKSKLPPICLRVDPLPKKNGTNGKVRSPRTTVLIEKDKSQEDNREQVPTMKEVAENNHNEINVKTSKSSIEGNETVQTFDSSESVVDVGVECASNNKKDDVSAVDIEMSTVDVSKEDEAYDRSGHLKQEIEQNKGEVDTSDCQKNREEEVRRVWLEEDAALFIQSAFRGYNVRRWKPLEKLRKIADIRDKMVDVRKQLYELESSSGWDKKQKDIIGETIMNLLLQLDSIQGLHPSLREIRKLVARELVYLQEQVDQLSNQVTNGHQETMKDDKIAIPDDAASVMCSIPVAKTVCSAADSSVNENSVTEQSSLSVAGDFTSELKVGTSSETSRCVAEVEEIEPVLQMVQQTLKDEPFIIEYNQACQQEDEYESQIIEGKLGEVEKHAVEEEIVRPSAGEIIDGILQKQHEGEQLQAFKEVTSVEVELDKKVNSDTVHEESSISFSKEFKLEAGIVVETDEEKKQNSIEGTKVESAEACDVKESAVIKLEEVTDGEILENTSIAKDVSEEFRPASMADGGEPSPLNTEAIVVPKEVWENEASFLKENNYEIVASPPSSVETTTYISSDIEPENITCKPNEGSPLITSVASLAENDLVKENIKLRQLLDRLLKAGEQQVAVISDLNSRVKSLENRLSKKKKKKSVEISRHKVSKSSCQLSSK